MIILNEKYKDMELKDTPYGFRAALYFSKNITIEDQKEILKSFSKNQKKKFNREKDIREVKRVEKQQKLFRKKQKAFKERERKLREEQQRLFDKLKEEYEKELKEKI